ncbi:MAG: DUF4349 domain-containing protein [Massilia sp.]
MIKRHRQKINFLTITIADKLLLMKNLILLVAILALAGCSRPSQPPTSESPQGVLAERYTGAAAAASDSKAAPTATRRYLAMTHRLTLLVPEARLAQDFAAIQQECIKLGCEIVSTDQEAEGRNRSTSASFTARVPPAAFTGFFSGVQAHGKLLSHHSESADKTAEVIDVDARIKNLEALRTRILELLAKNAGTLKELVEAERQLAETQAALDSINGQRRALAAQTDMIRIEIALRVASPRNDGKWTGPVVAAADEAGDVFMASVAFLLTTCVAILPWSVVIGAVLVPLWRAWRRRRNGKRPSEKN